MALSDKIQETVQRLSPEYQAEVLDFIEFLLERSDFSREEAPAGLSLDLAMRGLETEELPDYTLADVKVSFQ